jgi:hypothetical protein
VIGVVFGLVIFWLVLKLWKDEFELKGLKLTMAITASSIGLIVLLAVLSNAV